MIDKIVELENNKNYLILDETILNDKRFYFGLRLDDKEEPTNNYLFFEENIERNETFLSPVYDKDMKNLLLTSFTVNYLGKVYDEI